VKATLRSAGKFAGLAAFAGALVLSLSTAAHAKAVGGPAQIVSAGSGLPNTRQPLTTGSDQTAFSLQLPAGAACTGDSVHGQYRVQSFMVKNGVDPATLTFGEVGPEPVGLGPAFRQALFQQNTDAFVNAATNVASKAGGEGLIIDIPVFTLRGYKATELPVGQYVVGIACTKGPASPSQLDRYWSTTVDLSQGTGGASAGRVWTAPLVPSIAPPTTALGPSASPSPTTASAQPASEQPAAPVSNTDAATSPAPAPDRAAPSGGEPSFGVPAFQMFSSVGAPHGVTTFIKWLLLALVLWRLAVLVKQKLRPTAIPEVSN
jgi:hypothetical protein